MTPPQKPLAVRLYRALTRLLPGELGHRYADEAARVFEELHRDAVHEGSAAAGWLLWMRSSASLLACAIGEGRSRTGRTVSGIGTSRTTRGGGGAMGAFWSEIRFTARALAKQRAFAATVILILAAGIGATTSVYSVVDTVVLRPLPYPEAGRLVHFDEGDHSYPSLKAWLAMSSFESLAASSEHEVDLTQEGPPERLRGLAVSPDFFPFFGASPLHGRLFGPGDYPGNHSIVVLGHGLWLRRWGGDPSVVGRTLRLDGAPSEVIGVLGPSFQPPEGAAGGDRVDLWFPLDDGGDVANHHGMSVLNVVGRLRPGVSLEAAQAEVDAQRRAIARELPARYVLRDGTVRLVPLTPLHEATVRGVSGQLFTLLGAVGLLLLVACANVANLFLAHGTARAREVALRGALGASRGRIGARVLVESTMLSLAGGTLGVALAFGGVALFARFSPEGIPRIDTLAVDLRVLAFSSAVAVVTGIAFGALPALQAMRTAPGEALKEGAASMSAGQRGGRVRSGLVVSEIALAAVLVTGAGLLMRSLVAQVQTDPGFDPEGLAVISLDLGAEYDADSRRRFSDQVLERVRAIPGTRSAAAGWASPFKRTGRSRCCWRETVVGDPALLDEANPFRGMTHPVTPGYFRTLGATVAYGRELEPSDVDRPVAVLNRPAARWLFGTDDAVGRTLTFGTGPFRVLPTNRPSPGPETLEVIGVVDGVHEFGPTEGVEEAVYVPYARYAAIYGGLDVIVRSDVPPSSLTAALQDLVWALDPDLPIEQITTMERRMSASVASPRFLSGLVGGFAALALLLAAGGVYGSMLYTVGQRRREMGIRLALGAGGGDVVRLVLRHGMQLAAAGVLLGVAAALAVSGTIERLLWGVEPTDPMTIASVALLLGCTAVGAAFVPAWRAGRTDPVQTLKAE